MFRACFKHVSSRECSGRGLGLGGGGELDELKIRRRSAELQQSIAVCWGKGEINISDSTLAQSD